MILSRVSRWSRTFKHSKKLKIRSHMLQWIESWNHIVRQRSMTEVVWVQARMTVGTPCSVIRNCRDRIYHHLSLSLSLTDPRQWFIFDPDQNIFNTDIFFDRRRENERRHKYQSDVSENSPRRPCWDPDGELKISKFTAHFFIGRTRHRQVSNRNLLGCCRQYWSRGWESQPSEKARSLLAKVQRNGRIFKEKIRYQINFLTQNDHAAIRPTHDPAAGTAACSAARC
jgi:hypothetical protein